MPPYPAPMRRASPLLLLAVPFLLLACKSPLERAIDSGDRAKIEEALASPEVQAQVPEKGSRWVLRAIEAERPDAVSALLSGGVVKADAEVDGRPLVHHAVDRNESDAAERVLYVLLDQGATAWRADAQGRTALHLALDAHRLKFVRRLLGPFPDIGLFDKDPGRLLVAAATKGDAEVVEFLVSVGAMLEDPALIAAAQPPIQHQLELAHLQFRLKRAIDQGDFEGIKKLGEAATTDQLKALGLTSAHIAVLIHDRTWLGHLIKDPEKLQAVDAQGLGLLHYAAIAGEPRTATLLRKAGLDLEARTKAGRTPLMLAAEKGRVKMVTALLEAGAEKHAEDPQGHSALTLAALGGHPVTVTQLLAKDTVLVRRRFIDQAPTPALKAQLETAHASFLKRWAAATQGARADDVRDVKLGARTLRAVSGFDITPHVVGVLGDDVAPLQSLSAQKPDVFAELRDMKHGRTLLHWAALAGARKSAAWLIEQGFQLDAQEAREDVPDDLWTPLDFALQEGHLDVASLLAERGATEWRSARDAPPGLRSLVPQLERNRKLRDAWRDGLFHRLPDIIKSGPVARGAAGRPGPNDLQWRIIQFDALASLTPEELAAQAPAANSRSPSHLHLAAAMANPVAVNRLLALGVPLSPRDAYGHTPAGLAARAGDLASLRMLLDAGVDVATLGESGGSVMTMLCEPQPESARFLLERGAPAPEPDFWCWPQAVRQAVLDKQDALALSLLEHWKPSGARRFPADVALKAAQLDRVEVLRWLLAQLPAQLQAAEDGTLPAQLLKAAARSGAAGVVALLLERGLPSGSEELLQHALLCALDGRHSQVARLLLDKGAAPLKQHGNLEGAWRDGFLPSEYSKVTPVGLALARGDHAFLEHLATSRPEEWKQLRAAPEHLALAVTGGYLRLVRDYVEAGADARGKGRDGEPLPGLAGSEEVAAYLLERGARLDADPSTLLPDGGLDESTAYRDPTPFDIAVRRGDFGLARYFMKRGARPRVGAVRQYLGQMLVHIDDLLPVGSPRLQALAELLQEPAWTAAQRGELLALVSASRACKAPMILEAALTGLSREDVESLGRPALVNLAPCEDPRALQLLVERGASPHTEDAEGHTVLADAVRAQNLPAVKALLALWVKAAPPGGDVFAYVQLALEKQFPAAGRLLLERVMKDRQPDPAQRDAAFLLALRTEASDVAARLLADGASVQTEGGEGPTPLSLTVVSNWYWVMSLFLELGANDPDGKAFAHLLHQKHWPYAGLLVQRGVVPVETAADHLIQTVPTAPDAYAERDAKLGLLRDLAGEERFVLPEPLLDRMAHLAVTHDDLELTRRVLADGKVAVDAKNELGFTLLHEASEHASLEVVQLLVEQGADVNAEGIECIRPLTWADRRKDPEGPRVVKFLKRQGAEFGDC
jgi:ankyrin repeat protein